MKNKNIFNSHLIDTNMSYFAHMKRSLSLSKKSFIASSSFFIHSIFPFMFEDLGSSTIDELNSDIENFSISKENASVNGAVAIVLNKENKVLILKRSNSVSTYKGLWNFPAGGIDDGENPVDAAARECFEESGIKIYPKDMEFLTSLKSKKLNIYYFITKKYYGEPKINWESTDFEWVYIDEILSTAFVPIPKDLKKMVMEKI